VITHGLRQKIASKKAMVCVELMVIFEVVIRTHAFAVLVSRVGYAGHRISNIEYRSLCTRIRIGELD
jgi:hypothetical protein